MDKKDISYERFLNNKIRLPQIDYGFEDDNSLLLYPNEKTEEEVLERNFDKFTS
ncbi:hypothetical protein [Clostridium botulinum]|uniref:hypothetical protein n=1 Tax=Clostridium botulinum TaxID=1491 RepID=UPI00090B53A1|nr:hypothetical protein [Clostridium botulinum]APH21061.1 hypothetical protein NPD1_4119 [Clostridium botulinum]APQ71148.1 hypothetical protein RSJ8_4076 [Clostridium botulinum]